MNMSNYTGAVNQKENLFTLILKVMNSDINLLLIFRKQAAAEGLLALILELDNAM